MIRRIASVLAVLVCAGAPPAAAAQKAPAPAPATGSQGHQQSEGTSAPHGVMPPQLAGTWASAAERTQLTGAFEESVWGRNAVSERRVELRVDRAGSATLTVTNRIRDAKGRIVRGPTSIEQSELQIGAPTQTTAAGTDLGVTVVRAQRKYPDDPVSTWPLDGLRVRLVTRDAPNTIELRYDTPEGRGSFWETLTRSGASRGARKAQTAG